MKLTARQFAEILFDISVGLKGKDLSEKIKKFIKFLAKNRATLLLPRIISEYENVFNERKGILKINVTTSSGLSQKSRELLKEKFDKEIEFNEEVDEKILGGIIVKIKDTIIDGSLKTRLSLLRDKMARG